MELAGHMVRMKDKKSPKSAETKKKVQKTRKMAEMGGLP